VHLFSGVARDGLDRSSSCKTAVRSHRGVLICFDLKFFFLLELSAHRSSK